MITNPISAKAALMKKIGSRVTRDGSTGVYPSGIKVNGVPKNNTPLMPILRNKKLYASA